MTLIIGGAGQGKLRYVLEKTGLAEDETARDPDTARVKRIFCGVETWVREHGCADVAGAFSALLAANPDVICICDEVGCGVVPIAPNQRAWRETVGRLCCTLAEKADRVERIFCGLPLVLKGEGTWN